MAALTKDQRIIKQNPGKTPYELLELGLSQEGFEAEIERQGKIQKEQAKEAPKEPEAIPQPVAQKVVPVIKETHRAQPRTTSLPVRSDNGSVMVQITAGGRTRVEARSRKNAERMAKKYPHEYKILY